jgi:hypothetical protein
MSILEDHTQSTEVTTEMAIVELFGATKTIDEMRRSNEGRHAIIGNLNDIELVRDRLSRIVDDVRGV